MKYVLIIDPSETFVMYLSRVISRMGYLVQSANDVMTGLAIVERDRPDLLISEISLKEASGLQLCKELKKSPGTSDIPVVFITTQGAEENRQRAYEAGCSDFLTKPVSVREIHEMLQRNLTLTFKRLAMRVTAEVDAVIFAEKRRIESKTETLGEGGLLVRSDSAAFRVGTLVDLFLSLPSSSEPVNMAGEVAYILDRRDASSLPGIGIRYTKISREAADCVTGFIEQAVS